MTDLLYMEGRIVLLSKALFILQKKTSPFGLAVYLLLLH